MTQDDTSTEGTDALLNHFREDPTVEVDHAIKLYLNGGKRIPWRDVELIREQGYKIQDISNGKHQTKITLVRGTDAAPESK